MVHPQEYLPLFPEPYRTSLSFVRSWDSIAEIRMRRDLPFSLTAFDKNVFLGKKGVCLSAKEALICTADAMQKFVCAFCRGNMYRYFDTLKNCFLMDENGYRLGVVQEKETAPDALPESFAALNLRIPRIVQTAADPVLMHFQDTLRSTLILSPPGGGKTTLLRALASALSDGHWKNNPLRVCVIDERKELFPANFSPARGLCDIFSGYSKEEGLENAVRTFSPEVLIVDEIGGRVDAEGIRLLGQRGVIVFASAHAAGLQEAKHTAWIRPLLEEGVFSSLAFLQRRKSSAFSCDVLWEDLR